MKAKQTVTFLYLRSANPQWDRVRQNTPKLLSTLHAENLSL